MLGRFLEIGVATTDIAASVQFYERLGFTQLIANDIWPHLYGVLSDGRVHIGLHQRHIPTPSLTFVRPELARNLEPLRAAGITPELEHLGEDDFHEVRLRDPAGQAVTLLEARTYSPAPRQAPAQSLCGYFLHYGLPASDLEAAREFWERGGLVAVGESAQPYAHLPLTSDLLDLALHQRRSFDAPLLVFEVTDIGARVARLSALGVEPATELPFALERSRAALVRAPEGTLLLLLDA